MQSFFSDDDDDDDDDEDEPPAKKAKVDSSAPKKKIDNEGTQDLVVFVGGLPFSTEEEQLKKDFLECGEIEAMRMPKNDEGQSRGIAFITFKTKEGVEAALKFDGDDYGGRRLKVNMANSKGGEKGKGEKGDKGKGKGKGDKGKGKGNDELTVFVRGLSYNLTEETIKKDFAECGEIERCSVPMNEEGNPKGIAFIQYTSEEGVKKALEFDNQEYGGRTINVRKAGDRGEKGEKGGKGKDGKGKDGKGKKGKGKGKKGLSTEKMAAKDGAMVESTGTKQTFDESDDDDEPAAPKKAAAAKKAPVVEDSDDDED
mmetsp:Transcript_27620/g.79339  ORF Transcript_27620/g.79339 Transcript_27620/m.79339 type:complete len:313 (+) Transcript_27620:100-1038(+)